MVKIGDVLTERWTNRKGTVIDFDTKRNMVYIDLSGSVFPVRIEDLPRRWRLHEDSCMRK